MYSTPFTLSISKKVKAIALKEGYTNSDVASNAYIINNETIANPVISSPTGTYYQQLLISLTCPTAGALIKYTLDGTDPDENSTQYSIPFTLDHSTVLKVKAFKENYLPSSIIQTEYEIFLSSVPGMLFVQGGMFNNGSANVNLSDFYMGIYEVTQSEWFYIMGDHPSSGVGIGDNFPVYGISWFSVIKYCNLKSIHDGKTPCYIYDTFGTNPADWPEGWNTVSENHLKITCDWQADGYRLPSEMEWLYAALGGNRTHNYTYSGTNNLSEAGWYQGNSGNYTHVIGGKKNNELGFKDLTGNVLEWCWDIYGDYSTTDENNPHGIETGSLRVYRGGCWFSEDTNCRNDFRSRNYATTVNNGIGFRLVRKAD